MHLRTPANWETQTITACAMLSSKMKIEKKKGKQAVRHNFSLWPSKKEYKKHKKRFKSGQVHNYTWSLAEQFQLVDEQQQKKGKGMGQ